MSATFVKFYLVPPPPAGPALAPGTPLRIIVPHDPDERVVIPGFGIGRCTGGSHGCRVADGTETWPLAIRIERSP